MKKILPTMALISAMLLGPTLAQASCTVLTNMMLEGTLKDVSGNEMPLTVKIPVGGRTFTSSIFTQDGIHNGYGLCKESVIAGLPPGEIHQIKFTIYAQDSTFEISTVGWETIPFTSVDVKLEYSNGSAYSGQLKVYEPKRL